MRRWQRGSKEAARSRQNYCQSVTPGEGRILLYLAAHEDKIADECKWALFNLHQISARAKPREEGIKQACSADIEGHCSSVTPGQGRTLICLYDYNDDLSSSCDKALIDAELKYPAHAAPGKKLLRGVAGGALPGLSRF